MSNGPVNFEADRLSCLKFTNPLSFDNHNNIALSSNIDPDYNLFSDVFNCDYYIENSLNEMLAKKASYSDCVSLTHLNIRSINRNFNSLTTLLASINNKFSIIGISETWLQDSSHAADIDGYNFVHSYRSDRSGGGVGLYLTTELDYKLCNDVARIT
jgi:hypothetical protein